MTFERQFTQGEQSPSSETLISAGATIEGKIEAPGHVRIGGSLKGEAYVKGDLRVEPGAHISGEVRAENIIIGGEVEGNIRAAARVELLETAVLIGELKAASMLVAAGSRMRAKVEFGWDEQESSRVVPVVDSASR
ncbi:MAG: polymer-forming cytoskeletal protein [Candidatus Binatia bacterium]